MRYQNDKLFCKLAANHRPCIISRIIHVTISQWLLPHLPKKAPARRFRTKFSYLRARFMLNFKHKRAQNKYLQQQFARSTVCARRLTAQILDFL